MYPLDLSNEICDRAHDRGLAGAHGWRADLQRGGGSWDAGEREIAAKADTVMFACRKRWGAGRSMLAGRAELIDKGRLVSEAARAAACARPACWRRPG